MTFRSPRIVALPALAAALLLGGCTGGGKLAMRNAVGSGVQLAGSFTTGLYAYDDTNNLHVLLLEGPLDSPTQAVHIRMHWKPTAGKTPIDSRATNATIRYLVFTDANAGVYAGAGYLFPANTPGGSTFRANLRSASLQLDDASPGFIDRIGRAQASGDFSATLDDQQTFQRLKQLEKHLATKLGYPRFVNAPSASPTPNG